MVIPTLGGDSLSTTVAALNSGSLVPTEIIVCIPRNECTKIGEVRSSNTIVLPTDCQGQVAQRACGFKVARSKYVMQLDDDILVDKYCVQQLSELIRGFAGKVAVAPSLLDSSTGESVFRRPTRRSLTRRIYYWLLNGHEGYQPGRIYQSGSGDGLDPTGSDKRAYEVEWLAGGCVLHQRENLVLDDFYPFKGKAYCEDFIHSHLLRSKGVRLFVDANSTCYVDVLSYLSQDFVPFLKNLVHDYRARIYFMKLRSRKSIRVYFFYLAMVANYLANRLSSVIGR